MEIALQDEGIQPVVIYSEDGLKGALPYSHTDCYLVKLHGDYRDTRIKNTNAELEGYSPEWNALLDRILDEHGLIICGWSGDYDTALRNAILRCPNRRFPCYWTTLGKPSVAAESVIAHRRAEVVKIENADAFFTELLEKIESLEDYNCPHPLSVAEAVARVKRYIPEERHRIRLEDLFYGEARRLRAFFNSDEWLQTPDERKLDVCNAQMEKLAKMAAVLGYYGTERQAHILKNTLEMIYPVVGYSRDGERFTANMTGSVNCYPALLILYAAGVAAFAASNYAHLAAMMLHAETKGDQHNRFGRNLFSDCRWCLNSVAIQIVSEDDTEPRKVWISEYLFRLTKGWLTELIPLSPDYERIFDGYEIFSSVVFRWLSGDKNWTLLSRFLLEWRFNKEEVKDLIQKLSERIRRESQDILQHGFSVGDVDHFNEQTTWLAGRAEKHDMSWDSIEPVIIYTAYL